MSARQILSKFIELAQLNPSRFTVFDFLSRVSELGFYFLFSNPDNSPEQIVHLQNFIIDQKFKLFIDGNYFIDNGIPKGKQIFTIKTKLMEICINNPNLQERTSPKYQESTARLLIQQTLPH